MAEQRAGPYLYLTGVRVNVPLSLQQCGESKDNPVPVAASLFSLLSSTQAEQHADSKRRPPAASVLPDHSRLAVNRERTKYRETSTNY